ASSRLAWATEPPTTTVPSARTAPGPTPHRTHRAVPAPQSKGSSHSEVNLLTAAGGWVGAAAGGRAAAAEGPVRSEQAGGARGQRGACADVQKENDRARRREEEVTAAAGGGAEEDVSRKNTTAAPASARMPAPSERLPMRILVF